MKELDEQQMETLEELKKSIPRIARYSEMMEQTLSNEDLFATEFCLALISWQLDHVATMLKELKGGELEVFDLYKYSNP